MAGERAVFFIAVSSEAQAGDDRESLPEQRRALDDAAARFGWRVTDVIEVPGFSRSFYTVREFVEAAALSDLPDALRLFDHWTRRDFDVLAAVNTTRLGRDQSILAEVIRRTIDAGARVYTVKDGWIDAQNQRMHIAMSGYATGAEMDELKRRRDFGIRGRVKRGLPVGEVPGTHLLLREANGRAIRLVVDETKRRLFDDIHHLVTAERVAYLDLESRLVERGHAPMGSGVVYSWLRNVYTYGHSGIGLNDRRGQRGWQWVYDPRVVPPPGVTIYRDTHEAVWSGEPAAVLYAELDRRHALTGLKRPKLARRYTGLCVCARCGRPMRSMASLNARYHYLRCVDGCHKGSLPRPVVDAFIAGFIEAIAAGATLDALLRPPADPRPDQAARLDAEIADATAQTRALIRKQATAPAALYSLYDDDLTALAARLDALHAERARLQARAARPVSTPAPDTIQRAAAGFWNATEFTQNATLHMLLGHWRIAADHAGVSGFVLIGY
jgi:DNA invertase Pin-like site-specific DNA recombinase